LLDNYRLLVEYLAIDGILYCSLMVASMVSCGVMRRERAR
jgi:hypothetical protein